MGLLIPVSPPNPDTRYHKLILPLTSCILLLRWRPHDHWCHRRMDHRQYLSLRRLRHLWYVNPISSFECHHPRTHFPKSPSIDIRLDCADIPPGAFWLTFGGTLVPAFNSYGAYVTDPKVAASSMGNAGNPAGLQTPGFNASFAFFLVFMGSSPSPSPLSPLFHPYLKLREKY